MQFIKRVLHYLVLLLEGMFFGYGVCTMCALLIHKLCAGSVHRLSFVPLVLLAGALLLAALDEEGE